MADVTAPLAGRVRLQAAFGRLVLWGCAAALGLIIAANLGFLTLHVVQILRFPYPLDYGEGPLLTQVALLRDGTSLWQLYRDPAAPPFAVVNYPPVYHLFSLVFSFATGDVLLAGRLVSLAATFGAVVALWLLAKHSIQYQAPIALLIVTAFLALPIVREWSVLMRVDMLGVCLGLWGLVLVQRSRGRAILWAVPLLLASLYVKPSLLAAPAAAVVWLLFRDWRRGMLLALVLGGSGALLFGVLHLATGGWFSYHVLTANANEWQYALARGFWRDQLAIHWPLVAAAGVSTLLVLLISRNDARSGGQTRVALLLPLYYTIFGAMTALGVGKVGAYANYFLEFYAGLIWLAACVLQNHHQLLPGDRRIGHSRWLAPRPWSAVVILCTLAALLRYYPAWSETFLKPAGMIEGENPARIAFGGYGIWDDLQRERAVLEALGRINAALVTEVQSVDGPIVTDIPGVAAQANRLSQLQAFEHRQLYDVDAWDQRGLLLDLANGRVPLVVIDYLGNWLTPETITLITHRYGQEGSRGTYDLYRPVEPGPRTAAELRVADGLNLHAFHLAPPAGQADFEAGELVLLTLVWQADQQPLSDQELDVVVQLTDEEGRVLLETARPLLYGAFPPVDWPVNTEIQHLHPIQLPLEVPARTYTLALTLRAAGRDLAPPQPLTPLAVAERAGQMVGERGYYVPGPLFREWQRLGGFEGLGDAISPAVPFASQIQQCFVRGCLQLHGQSVTRVPLGELVPLGDAGVTTGSGPHELDPGFRELWVALGGEEQPGPPVSNVFVRRDYRGEWIAQYTRYTRLERRADGSDLQQANLGEEYLRLPGGVPYRWP